MKIGLVGFGRMGKLIYSICMERGHSIPHVFDPAASADTKETSFHPELREELLHELDAVIDFSLPEGILGNIQSYCTSTVPAVIGTTGWDSEREQIRQQIESGGGSLLYGSNFSVGANLFFALTERLAQLIEPFPNYDILMHEFHHRNKQDSPSGTALSAAARILQNSTRKQKVQSESLQRAIHPEELHVTASRGGEIPGLHMILADSAEDTIEIRHTARSRRGFALGAVLAAEWLSGKKGFFSFEDYFHEALQ
ncbi:4-hydroxy-tetrahydrodipicolinate reductase [Spirochaeta dissipatitropha]